MIVVLYAFLSLLRINASLFTPSAHWPVWQRGHSSHPAVLLCISGRLSFPASCQVSQEVQSLVSRLLCLEPLVRIGASGGVEEVMRHKWFSGVCWNVSTSARAPVIAL